MLFLAIVLLISIIILHHEFSIVFSQNFYGIKPNQLRKDKKLANALSEFLTWKKVESVNSLYCLFWIFLLLVPPGLFLLFPDFIKYIFIGGFYKGMEILMDRFQNDKYLFIATIFSIEAVIVHLVRYFNLVTNKDVKTTELYEFIKVKNSWIKSILFIISPKQSSIFFISLLLDNKTKIIKEISGSDADKYNQQSIFHYKVRNYIADSYEDYHIEQLLIEELNKNIINFQDRYKKSDINNPLNININNIPHSIRSNDHANHYVETLLEIFGYVCLVEELDRITNEDKRKEKRIPQRSRIEFHLNENEGEMIEAIIDQFGVLRENGHAVSLSIKKSDDSNCEIQRNKVIKIKSIGGRTIDNGNITGTIIFHNKEEGNSHTKCGIRIDEFSRDKFNSIVKDLKLIQENE